MNKLIFLLLQVFLLATACQQSADRQVLSAMSLDLTADTLELFAPGWVSTRLNERDMAISEKGDELIFTIGNHNQEILALVGMKKEGEKWSEPELLDFSGQHHDIEPFFAPGGRQLFFASDRPMGEGLERKDYNIWVCDKEEGKWGAPRPLSESINTQGNEFYPAVSSNGNLYFTATLDNGVGKEDIFFSKFKEGQYLQPVPLDTNINSITFEFNAYISPDEDLIVFSSYGRADGLGGGDLYYSRKDTSGQWRKAIHFDAPLNSEKLDYCPFIDFPRDGFYFTSNRPGNRPEKMATLSQLNSYANGITNGMGNIYRIRLSSLRME